MRGRKATFNCGVFGAERINVNVNGQASAKRSNAHLGDGNGAANAASGIIQSETRRDGRVAEGGGLLNRYRV